MLTLVLTIENYKTQDYEKQQSILNTHSDIIPDGFICSK